MELRRRHTRGYGSLGGPSVCLLKRLIGSARLESVGKLRAAAGPARWSRAAWAWSSRSREPPTQVVCRWSLPLTRPHTLADLRWPGRSFAHVGQAREHGPQAVKPKPGRSRFPPEGKVEDQYAFQRGRRLARLAACTAKPVGSLAAASAMPRYALTSARRSWSCSVA